VTAALYVVAVAALYVLAALLFAVGTTVVLGVRQGIRDHRASQRAAGK
jgi:hypothetical protein